MTDYFLSWIFLFLYLPFNFAMRTKDGRELAKRMNVILIELPKVEKLLDSIETNTALENWAIYLSYADIPSKRGLIERLTEKEKGLMDAQVSLTTISENKEYWINQFRQETRERDIYSGLQSESYSESQID